MLKTLVEPLYKIHSMFAELENKLHSCLNALNLNFVIVICIHIINVWFGSN